MIPVIKFHLLSWMFRPASDIDIVYSAMTSSLFLSLFSLHCRSNSFASGIIKIWWIYANWNINETWTLKYHCCDQIWPVEPKHLYGRGRKCMIEFLGWIQQRLRREMSKPGCRVTNFIWVLNMKYVYLLYVVVILLLLADCRFTLE